jgi:hypothetical protein
VTEQPAGADIPPPEPALPTGDDPGIEPTGDARVDEALVRLSELRGIPVADHVEVYAAVHDGLVETLGDFDAD